MTTMKMITMTMAIILLHLVAVALAVVEDGGRGQGPRPGRRGGLSDGRMVSYNQSRLRGGPPPPSPFTRGLCAICDKIPDPTDFKDTILSATKAARERTSQISSNIYREVMGLTLSELERIEGVYWPERFGKYSFKHR
mmetsp:Transcript_6993/g.15942  ORF Transcript_6993/g.15942 Transcript_6993/m.15942 type:complete len:138 (+) Transcript_6993:1527-1940(+)